MTEYSWAEETNAESTGINSGKITKNREKVKPIYCRNY